MLRHRLRMERRALVSADLCPLGQTGRWTERWRDSRYHSEWQYYPVSENLLKPHSSYSLTGLADVAIAQVTTYSFYLAGRNR